MTVLPPPAGFGNCPACAFFASGPPAICQACAAATLQPAEPFYCTVCGQRAATATSHCSNPMCTDPSRQFDFNSAIAMKTGPLDRAIKNHKYEKKWGWGVIFARVLLGHLASHPRDADTHLIIPMPAEPLPHGETSRAGIDHAGWIVESAAAQDDRRPPYPFRVDPPVAIKTRPTQRMVSTGSVGERRAVAQDIYAAVHVIDPTAVHGRIVTVVDDVFTTGHTLNAVARRLREAGAVSVRGLTMARQPWQ